MILKAGNEYKENNPAACRYAYVQFQSMNGKKKFLKAMDINCCRRGIMRCKKQDDEIAHKYISGKWPHVESAPDPSLIIWANLGKGKIERCGRSSLSLIISIILLLMGFAAIIYLLNEQDKYKSDIVCGELKIDEIDAYEEYLELNSFDTELNECFCLQEFKTLTVDVGKKTFPDGSEPCKKWFEDYTLSNALAVMISIAMSALNFLLRFTLRKSTKYEGHHTVTSQLSSAFSKMWVVQFVNTAVILLIINNRLNDDGLIRRVLKSTGTENLAFDGDYADFNTEWYNIVGITIFTTAFINGITPVFTLLQMCIAGCKRCLDRGCSSDRSKTSKIIQSEYEAVYTGGQIEFDNRFSQLIAMIWVIMMFSAAIPVLYLAGFMLCFVIYWTDKTLFLKFYSIPPRFGSDLAHQARNIIEWSLLIHLFMGLYMLSNPDIFTSEEEDNQAVDFFREYAEFIASGISILTGVDSERFGQIHTVLYSVGISIFSVLFIIEKVSNTFSRLMRKICCCCLNKNAEVDVFSNDLYNDINMESQRKEYDEAKRLHAKIKQAVRRDPHHEFQALRYFFQTRILLKIKQIKYNLVCALSMTKTQTQT